MVKLEDFDEAEKKKNRLAANRLLFTWLSDDDERAELYRLLLKTRRVLTFQSRADTKARATDPGPSNFHQDVYLITARAHVERALRETDNFSNIPYEVLGSGTFMLGMDKNPDHAEQRKFAMAYLALDKDQKKHDAIVAALATLAFRAAVVLPLKQRRFDLADLAEQAAARFAGFLFGYEQADHLLIEKAMRAAYRGLNYQIVGRHFVSEPGTMVEANANMGQLLKRTADLIGLYRNPVGRAQKKELDRIKLELDELKDFENEHGAGPLRDFVPVLRRIAAKEAHAPDYSGTQLAVIVVGLIAGTIGNIQASVSIAINEFFRSSDRFELARVVALAARQGEPGAEDKLRILIWEALRLNPPAAFLPRRTINKVTFDDKGADGNPQVIPTDSVVLLAMGGATRDPDVGVNPPDAFNEGPGVALDTLIFGGDDGTHLHQCVGRYLVTPVISRIVRGIMVLPGLARSLDPETGELLPLEKLWGIICENYPLEFDREAGLLQSPLIVVMNVRTPVAKHAEDLKLVIKYGAPRIEKKLQDSGHVHFASFLFIENDTKLVLCTWYDRDFDSYIEHFALQIGPLFDRIFEHIQDPPPLPVNKFPKEFVDTIRRYNVRPAGDYFFSAYPKAGVSAIVQQFPREKP